MNSIHSHTPTTTLFVKGLVLSKIIMLSSGYGRECRYWNRS